VTKYQPFQDFLVGQTTNELDLTFPEIERTLGFHLPHSARVHNAWWSNHAESHAQARAWLEAGWQAWQVNLKEETVLFRKKRPAPPSPPPGARADLSTRRICVDTALLSPAAARLLREYSDEMAGSESAALARAVHEAAIARRGRLIDQIVANAPRMPAGEPDSVQLIREDRDVR